MNSFASFRQDISLLQNQNFSNLISTIWVYILNNNSILFFAFIIIIIITIVIKCDLNIKLFNRIETPI